MQGTSVLYQHKRQKIGLTALIDVVFILLMFFMLTTSFINEQQINMKMPASGSSVSKQASAVVVMLNEDGRMTTNDVVLNDLNEKALGELDWYVESRPVILLPKADVEVQNIVTALELLAVKGIKKVTLGNAKNE